MTLVVVEVQQCCSAQRAHDVAEQPRGTESHHDGDEHGQDAVEPEEATGEVDDQAADGERRLTRPLDRLVVAVGRDLEAMALACAVRWPLDHRVLHIGTRTVAVR